MFQFKKDKGIMSLVIIFVVGLVGLAMMTTMSAVALNEINKNINAQSGSLTFYTAEAAARDAAYKCVRYSDCNASATALPFSINKVEGTTTINNSVWPYVKVQTVTQNNKTQHEITYNLTTYPEGLAFDFAVFSQGDINLSGNSDTNGNIFSNNNINVAGSATVEGDANSVGETTGSTDQINGSIDNNVEPIPAPQVDLTQYKDAATNNNALFTSATNLGHYLQGHTRSGVIFASTSAPVNISNSHTNLSGSLDTLGNLSLSGGTYTATNNYVALYVNGNLSLSGGVYIKGIVYVNGDTSVGNGGATIQGALISVGGVSQTNVVGTANIIYDQSIVSNWANTVGLVTTSSKPPMIIGWQEQ